MRYGVRLVLLHCSTDARRIIPLSKTLLTNLGRSAAGYRQAQLHVRLPDGAFPVHASTTSQANLQGYHPDIWLPLPFALPAFLFPNSKESQAASGRLHLFSATSRNSPKISRATLRRSISSPSPGSCSSSIRSTIAFLAFVILSAS